MSAPPRSTEARTRILEAAIDRFAREGTIGTRLTDIGADAGVSIGAIYHHFPDKQALADAALDHALGSYQDAFWAELSRHRDAREGIVAIVAFHIDWCRRRPQAARLLSTAVAPAAGQLNRAFFADVLGWYEVHVEAGELRRLPVMTLYALWLGPATVIVRDQLHDGAREVSRKDVELLGEAAWLTLSTGAA